LANIFKLNY